MAEILHFTRADGIKLAYRLVDGAGPLLVFLPGYMSDMAGGKATAMLDWAAANGRACLLLDYAGCGLSEGDFADQTLTGWRDDVLAMLEALSEGPVVLVGSSLGGWLMLMIGEALGDRLAGLVGIAPAPDFTQWGFSETRRATLIANGVVYEDNPYGPNPTPTWRDLFESGEANLMLDRIIAIDCPVRLLHGQADADVPWKISLKLAAALRSSDVRVMLIKDGDHRLSRAQDVALLLATVAELACG